MFDDVYEVLIADTPASRAIHHKVRFHVYCRERGYEDAAAHATGEERDGWDDDAVHFVVRERAAGRCVGAMRLILPRTVDFPVETLGCLDPTARPRLRRQSGEISRICLIRSPGEWMYGGRAAGTDIGSVPKSRELEVLLGMLRAVKVYAVARGIEWCYVLVSEVFARRLRAVGVVLVPAGTVVEHRGRRTPYLVRLRESAASMRTRSPAVDGLFGRAALAYRHCSDLDPDTVAPDSLLIAPEVARAPAASRVGAPA
jgi:N-acyl amino acid synthase of PEP-CTERM/exosortase system